LLDNGKSGFVPLSNGSISGRPKNFRIRNAAFMSAFLIVVSMISDLAFRYPYVWFYLIVCTYKKSQNETHCNLIYYDALVTIKTLGAGTVMYLRSTYCGTGYLFCIFKITENRFTHVFSLQCAQLEMNSFLLPSNTDYEEKLASFPLICRAQLCEITTGGYWLMLLFSL
jgi:hypothetical protein